MDHDTYESPLATRNASPEMLRLFSSKHRIGLWRKLWLELARCQRELGLNRISDEAVKQMEAKLGEIDFARAGRQGDHSPGGDQPVRRRQRRPDHHARRDEGAGDPPRQRD
jgi:hypothetical protein